MAADHSSPPVTLTPPASAEAQLDWLRLLRSRRVGPTTFFRLILEHGSASAALAALPEVARAAGVGDYAVCPPAVAQAELREAGLAGARPIFFGAPDYPRGLADLADAPPLLWAIGDVALLHRPAVALVGARNASSLGTRMARTLARDLADAGFVVVSGLARGIDTAAHAAALDGGTVAVLAGGVDVVYPPENAALAQEIGDKGLRLSEQPMGTQPQARHFPRRNRLVSGLASAVVVVEAAAKSGSLITARQALDQGRDVLAVPGHPFDARASGCNMLIRDGATLIRGAQDVIEALGPVPSGRPARARPATAADAGSPPTGGEAARRARESVDLHEQILSRLGPSPLAEDQLIRDLGLAAGAVAPELVTLELEGRIRRHPGGLLSLAE